MLSFFASIPRVEALRTSTLGYEIATPTELPRVRTINDGLLISLPSPCNINEWRTTTTAIPPTAPLHLIIYIGRTSLPTLGYEKAPDRVGAVPSTSSCFSTGVSRTFFTAAGRFLNRGGCCRHAAHNGGDGDNGKEENLFSDRHWLQHHQGEADSVRHGFLCLPHPLAASTNGGRQPRRYPQPPHSTLLYI